MTAVAETQSPPFADWLFERYIAAMEVLEVHIGDRLGLYETLADLGALNSRALASATSTNERYVREWLEAQAAGGILDVENPEAGALERRFSISDDHAEVLVKRDSLDYMAPIARVIAATGQALPQVLDAFRTGAGVPWTAYGADGREAQADQNRALFLNELGREWLPSLPDIHARLSEGGRVADVASGGGWSSIAIAQAYPNVEVDGYDLDEASVELARANAADYGLSERVASTWPTPPIPGWPEVRPGHDLRGAARRAPPGRAARDAAPPGGLDGAVSRWTSAWRIRSRRPPGTSTG